ncbi:2'-5' RNA ligase family protein [Phenylobacterium sp.]|uniref:2'-5' RNA ligase family protein n=1 Tax=Phenylobacterium sp. TaxID=1871053 RepID=UPI0019A32647|nr:2'-5' RNA ligase family protein [Phenylobacterium sp.]MBC7167927.1 2'-5' RNA ligase family protein [Phenylobacterium sp.]
MIDHPPLIVTAALDEGAFAWFDDLRRSHFPKGRNQVPAHLTLFHALPGAEETAVAEVLKAAAGRRAPMRLEVRGPWFLGRGVAYRIASPELEDLRAELAAAFSGWLTPQDRAPFRPHITIQNKAEPDAARALLEDLQQAFEPFDIWAEGLEVWRYLGGPWSPAARLAFGDASPAGSGLGEADGS